MPSFKFIFFTLVFSLGGNILFAQNLQGFPTGEERFQSSNIQFEKEVLTLVNKVRKRHGLPPLQVHAELTNAARYHAKDMAVENYFEHDSYDRLANGRKRKISSLGERLSAFSTTLWLGWAENIAMGQHSAESVMEDWMKSKWHRTNILNPDYKYIGIAYIDGYWVQNFSH